MLGGRQTQNEQTRETRSSPLRRRRVAESRKPRGLFFHSSMLARTVACFIFASLSAPCLYLPTFFFFFCQGILDFLLSPQRGTTNSRKVREPMQSVFCRQARLCGIANYPPPPPLAWWLCPPLRNSWGEPCPSQILFCLFQCLISITETLNLNGPQLLFSDVLFNLLLSLARHCKNDQSPSRKYITSIIDPFRKYTLCGMLWNSCTVANKSVSFLCLTAPRLHEPPCSGYKSRNYPLALLFWGFVSLMKCLHLITVASQVSALERCLNVGLRTLGSRARSPRGWSEFCLVFPIYLLTTPVHVHSFRATN